MPKLLLRAGKNKFFKHLEFTSTSEQYDDEARKLAKDLLIPHQTT